MQRHRKSCLADCSWHTDRDAHQRSVRCDLSAGDILTLLRQLNIPCSIDSFSELGWTAKLGSPEVGFYAQQSRFPTLDAAAQWLLDEARRQYPGAMLKNPEFSSKSSA